MKELPKVPTMTAPFAAEVPGGIGDDFPADKPPSGQASLSYSDGIPDAYARPDNNGKVLFTVEEMNRIGYNATCGTFRYQLGVGTGNDTSFSNAIGGYPKWAMLNWFQFAVIPPYSMPGDIVPSFTGVVSEIDASDTKYYHRNDVVWRNGFWVVKTAVSGADLDVNLTEYAVPIVISSIVESVSREDDNQSFNPQTGPVTLSNGWTPVDVNSFSPSPKYSQVFDDERIVQEANYYSSSSLQPVTIKEDGWLLIHGARSIDDDSFKTPGELVTALSDGISVHVSYEGSDNGDVYLDFRYGASDEIARSVPIRAGGVFQMTLTNDFGADSSVVVRLVGNQ